MGEDRVGDVEQRVAESTDASEAEPSRHATMTAAAPRGEEFAADAPRHVAEPATRSAPVTQAAVRAESSRTAADYVLPMDSLVAVAESAGLQWVNSDAEKIRAVQQAMAAMPPPVHRPREIRPVEVVDEGPLVLVETKKDLSQFKLPFETSQGSQPQA